MINRTGRLEKSASRAASTCLAVAVSFLSPLTGTATAQELFIHRDGGPDELQPAALRRAWTADPAIRSFRGLQENDWNFNEPGVPGFGGLGPEVDVKGMVAKVFGEAPRLSLAAAAVGRAK